MEVWAGEKGRKVYDARKIWLELNAEGIPVARCTVERRMRELGIRGASPRAPDIAARLRGVAGLLIWSFIPFPVPPGLAPAAHFRNNR